jgi:hypothetical protein
MVGKFAPNPAWPIYLFNDASHLRATFPFTNAIESWTIGDNQQPIWPCRPDCVEASLRRFWPVKNQENYWRQLLPLAFPKPPPAFLRRIAR